MERHNMYRIWAYKKIIYSIKVPKNINNMINSAQLKLSE